MKASSGGECSVCGRFTNDFISFATTASVIEYDLSGQYRCKDHNESHPGLRLNRADKRALKFKRRDKKGNK